MCFLELCLVPGKPIYLLEFYLAGIIFYFIEPYFVGVTICLIDFCFEGEIIIYFFEPYLT